MVPRLLEMTKWWTSVENESQLLGFLVLLRRTYRVLLSYRMETWNRIVTGGSVEGLNNPLKPFETYFSIL